jgi:hypothetical protein
MWSVSDLGFGEQPFVEAQVAYAQGAPRYSIIIKLYQR